jgi:glucose/arabinose dehydrogenase
MRLPKAFNVLLTALALSLCLVPATWAQAQAQAQQAKPAAEPAKKPAHKAKATAAAPKAAPKATPKAAPNANAAAPNPAVVKIAERDPFVPLVNEHKPGGGPPLPPGKAGLVVATIRVDGAIRAPNGMFAVVTNPDQRVYFLREGDQLYDGDVEKIGLDGVTFKEVSKDAFGKSVEKIVTKRIYPSAGEQQ